MSAKVVLIGIAIAIGFGFTESCGPSPPIGPKRGYNEQKPDMIDLGVVDGKNYYVTENFAMNYTAAQNYCQSSNTQLASIPTETQKELMETIINAISSGFGSETVENLVKFWITSESHESTEIGRARRSKSSESDESPEKKNSNSDESSEEKPNKGRGRRSKSSESDESPEKKPGSQNSNSDESSEEKPNKGRGRRSKSSESDESPEKKSGSKNSNSDESSEEKPNKGRGRRSKSSESDESPEEKKPSRKPTRKPRSLSNECDMMFASNGELAQGTAKCFERLELTICEKEI